MVVVVADQKSPSYLEDLIASISPARMRYCPLGQENLVIFGQERKNLLNRHQMIVANKTLDRFRYLHYCL